MNKRSFKIKIRLEQLIHTFRIILLFATIAFNLTVAQQIQTPPAQAKPVRMRFISIEPTVLFIKQEGELLQMIEVTVENFTAPTQASLDIVANSKLKTKNSKLSAQISKDFGKIEKGRTTLQVYIPDINEPTSMKFILKADGKVHDQRKILWQPGRHWKVYMVPISHHDLGYTDTIENVLCQYDSFYDDVLRFCHWTENWPEESKFRYTVESSWSIQHFIENRPKQYIQKFVKYIKEGRIEIGALFGNQISALCSHEELIRLMYPSFRLKRKYGVDISTGSITDVPGLSWGLPTVLAGAGIKYFFAGLPTYFEWGRSDIHTFWDEQAILRHGRPDAFKWQGPDGETVLVYYQGGYGCWSPSSYQEALNQLPGMLSALQDKGCPFSVVRYAGFGCVDNRPPDIRVSYIAREWNNNWAYPKLIVATNSMFFSELEKQCQDIRVFRGELPHTDYVVGATCSAKQTGINRITSDKLHTAEKFATIASVVGDYSYPAERIRRAYDNALLYDEHTWGMAYPAGPIQDWSWNDKSRFAYKAAALAQSILSESIRNIAKRIKLEKTGRHIIVFNSLCFQRTDVVKVPMTAVAMGRTFDIIDKETGKSIPYQIVKLDNPQAPVPYSAHHYGRGQFHRQELFELVFVAENVPSMGYKTYRLVPKENTILSPSSIMVGETTLENRFYKITLDPQIGTIESIYDKELAREIVDPNAPHKLNQLITKWVQTGKQQSPKNAKIRKGQTGPIYGSLIVNSQAPGCPQLTQEIILYDRIKRIDLANRVLKDSTPLLEIYFAFPFNIDQPEISFEGSNSVIRPFLDQFPGSNSNYYAVGHWANVFDGEIGVTLSPIESHLLEFGGLWPCYVSQAHHGVTPPDFGRPFVKPSEIKKGYMYSFVIDTNFRTNFKSVSCDDMLFRYSITTHKGAWREGHPRNFGWAVANPLIPICITGKKGGTLGEKISFAQVDKPNVFLLTLKQAEDSDGIIIRLIETEGKATSAIVTLPHLTIKKAYRTNIVEENEASISFTEHQVTIPIKAFGIATLRLKTSL